MFNIEKFNHNIHAQSVAFISNNLSPKYVIVSNGIIYGVANTLREAANIKLNLAGR